MIKTNGPFFLIVWIFLALLPACAEAQKEYGYYKTSPRISNDSVEKFKAAIKAISNDRLEGFQYTGANRITINYRLLRPGKTNTEGKCPLVLVLHGSGAIGTDNTAQLGLLVKYWAQPSIQEKYPAYIVAPQFPVRSSNYTPDLTRKVLVSTPDPCLSAALQLIDSLKKVLPVDERKVYVLGFSMGGSGVINSIGLRPGLFAAGLAVSGIPDFNHLAILAKTPLWLVHGNADPENPFATDSLLLKEMQVRKAPYVRFWEIDGLAHDVFSGLLAGDAIPAWLFHHQQCHNVK